MKKLLHGNIIKILGIGIFCILAVLCSSKTYYVTQDKIENNKEKIVYPVVHFNNIFRGKKEERINKLVLSALFEALPFLDESDVTFDTDFVIKNVDNNYLSFIYQGIYIVDKQTVNSFAIGVIIDLKHEKIVDIHEVIGKKGLKKIRNEILAENYEVVWGILQKEADIPLDIDKEVMSQTYFYNDSYLGHFYIKNEKIGVIVSGLPRMVGNYSILEVPYDAK